MCQQRAQKLPDVTHNALNNQVVVSKKTDCQQRVVKRCPGVIAKRHKPLPRALQHVFVGRITQQRADPGMMRDTAQIPLLQYQAFYQQRQPISSHFQAILQHAVAESFLHNRSAKTQQIPGQQAACGCQIKDGLNSGVGAGKEDRILRQPLQRGVRGEGKMLAQQRLWPSAAIKLARAGLGD